MKSQEHRRTGRGCGAETTAGACDQSRECGSTRSYPPPAAGPRTPRPQPGPLSHRSENNTPRVHEEVLCAQRRVVLEESFEPLRPETVPRVNPQDLVDAHRDSEVRLRQSRVGRALRGLPAAQMDGDAVGVVDVWLRLICKRAGGWQVRGCARSHQRQRRSKVAQPQSDGRAELGERNTTETYNPPTTSGSAGPRRSPEARRPPRRPAALAAGRPTC